MPQKISYWVEGRVLFHSIMGDLSAADLIESNALVSQLVHEGHAPVHYVIDAARLGNVEVKLNGLKDIVTLFGEPNIGWIVMVKGNVIARFFASVMTQQGHIRFRIVESLDDAWYLLRRVDSTLPTIPPEPAQLETL